MVLVGAGTHRARPLLMFGRHCHGQTDGPICLAIRHHSNLHLHLQVNGTAYVYAPSDRDLNDLPGKYQSGDLWCRIDQAEACSRFGVPCSH